MEKIQLLNEDECTKIKDFILNNEQKIKTLGPDIYPGTGEDSLTGRYSVYNYMYDLPGKIILPKFKKIFTENNLMFPISIQSWANTYRKNEGINIHHHAGNFEKFICANLFIDGEEDIGTNFIINNEDINIKSKKGEIIFFDSLLDHYAKKNTSNSIRITMAFDIYLGTEEKNLNRYYILK